MCRREEKISPAVGPMWQCAAAAFLVLSIGATAANAQLRSVWQTRTDSGLQGEDVDGNVKIDGQGSAVTIGWMYAPGSAYDLLVHKYDRSGRLLWSATYDGPGHGDDFFGSSIIDSSNNLITCGTTVGVNGDHDIVTLKYNTNGQLVWERRYNGPANSDDSAYGVEAVGLDSSDNVYVAGYSLALDGFYEFVTIKYNPAGAEQWVRRYRGPHPYSFGWVLAVTAAGNVYVGGDVYNLAGNADFALLKYDSAGNLLWDRLFDSAYHGSDSVYTLAIDAAENVFLTGISESQYLTGDFEYCTVKYASDGTFQWAGRYGGNYGFHYGWLVVPDESGGAYVSGASMTAGGEYDVGTVRFDANGVLMWAQRYRSNYFGDDWAYDLALDTAGNLLVVGYGWQGFGRGDDAYLVKYSPAGVLLDAVEFNGEASGDDYWVAVEVDPATGRVVVCGTSLGLGTGTDSLVAKFTTAPPATLTVQPDPLVAGQFATFTFTNGEPFALSYLGYSLSGTGSLFVPFLNVTLGLSNPIQAGGPVTADVNGTAVWILPIPQSASGLDVWLQAAQYNVTTNVVATHVN